MTDAIPGADFHWTTTQDDGFKDYVFCWSSRDFYYSLHFHSSPAIRRSQIPCSPPSVLGFSQNLSTAFLAQSLAFFWLLSLNRQWDLVGRHPRILCRLMCRQWLQRLLFWGGPCWDLFLLRLGPKDRTVMTREIWSSTCGKRYWCWHP